MTPSNSTPKHFHFPAQKTHNSWKVYPSNTSSFKLVKSDRTSAISEARELVQKLSCISQTRVRAIVPIPSDNRWVEFEIELSSNQDLLDSTWEQLQDLVIDCEWELRDRTQEKWYFDIELVEDFNEMREGSKIIAASYMQSSQLSSSKQVRRTERSQLKLIV